MLREDRVDGLRRVTFARDALEVSVLPELGGKIASVRFAGGARNVLLDPPEFPYRRAAHGAPFEAYDTSGFDDCFPTVAPCGAPDAPRVELLPDHGELWSAEWTCEPEGDGLRMEAALPGRRWRFARRVSIAGRTLKLAYELTSLVDRPLSYLWAAHPLLAASEGSRIVLPPEVDRVRVEYSRGWRLGPKGTERLWPQEGLEVLKDPRAGWAEKLFTGRLRDGFCAFHDEASGVTTILRFDVNAAPYVGLWVCQGGWPESRAARHFTVALEPTTSPYDSLAEACAKGECRTLLPRGIHRWALELEFARKERGR